MQFRSFIVALVVLAPVPALADSCADLWYARNSIYKSAGYCFQTIRAQQALGNEGCSYREMSEVPLSPRQRSIIADLVRQERYQGCPR